jgi:hypothetical protein
VRVWGSDDPGVLGGAAEGRVDVVDAGEICILSGRMRALREGGGGGGFA